MARCWSRCLAGQTARALIEVAYDGVDTSGLAAGRWIWWAQALRDSTRNTGITFEVQAGPTADAHSAAGRRSPYPAASPADGSAGSDYAARGCSAPHADDCAAQRRLRRAGLALARAGHLARLWLSADRGVRAGRRCSWRPTSSYELVLVASNQLGTVYNAGSVRGKGDTCDGVYSTAVCQADRQRAVHATFHPDGVEGRGEWYVQVVRQTGADQYTAVSPPSESRTVLLKPRS